MYNIAVLGFGVVGSGIYEVLSSNSEHIKKSLGDELNIKYILDKRTFPGHPLSAAVTTELGVILADKSVSVVAETIGGTGAAFEFTKAALEAGKSVVTSNKDLVDKHGGLLSSIAAKNGVSYLYEASAGGGIPLINPLKNCFRSNRIIKIAGILNGTTNFILTKIKECGMSFDQALSLAKEKGYAEANPDSDIKGYDSARKICILAGIAFGGYVPFCALKNVEGIERVTSEDLALASQSGYNIKLIASAQKTERGISISVAPRLVEKGCLLYNVDGVFNAVSVVGADVGEVIFYGQGAGSLPTASAVVNDIIEAIKYKSEQINGTKELVLDQENGEETKIRLKNGAEYEIYSSDK